MQMILHIWPMVNINKGVVGNQIHSAISLLKSVGRTASLLLENPRKIFVWSRLPQR